VRVVLDAEAVNALLDPRHSAERTVRRAMDALLSRESSDALLIRDIDRRLARLVGGLLAQAHAGSALLADAYPVAVAVEAGGGVVLTGDPDDLSHLAGPYQTVVIEPLGPSAKLRIRRQR
jgi:predicted nucleic acid-binding protein